MEQEQNRNENSFSFSAQSVVQHLRHTFVELACSCVLMVFLFERTVFNINCCKCFENKCWTLFGRFQLRFARLPILKFQLIVWRDLNSTHCAQWRYSYFVTAFLDLVDGIFFDLSIYRRYRAVTVFFRSDGIKILSSLYPPEKNAVNWRHFQNQKKYCRETWRHFF